MIVSSMIATKLYVLRLHCVALGRICHLGDHLQSLPFVYLFLSFILFGVRAYHII